MENVTDDIIDDAVQLCEKALQTMNDDVTFRIGMREISMEEPFQPGTRKSGILLYKNRKTRQLLEEYEIICLRNIHNNESRMNPLENTIEDERRFLSGYFKVDFNYIKAEQFLTQQKDKFILSIKKGGSPAFSTPLGTKWEDITIQFIDGNYVYIIIGKNKTKTTYRDMGFEDTRANKPNVNWDFLYSLSKTGGEITWKDASATNKGKKRKQKASDTLKSFFGINSDPFYDYKNGYHIKIRLIPDSSQFRTSKNPHTIDDDIDEALTEMTPSVYTS